MHYEVLFPTIAGVYDPTTAVNSMQIGEVGLLAAAPEPAETAAMLVGGLGLLGLIARKRRINA
jgi:hypothetical protein